VGLLTRIFGNREDDAAAMGEVSDETIDGNEMLEPDERAPERPGEPADTLDAPPNGQPIPGSGAPRHRHTGASGAAVARRTPRGAAVDAAGRDGAVSTAPRQRPEAPMAEDDEDSEEIDVSDQLEEVDDIDTPDALDALDDLILEEEDEEEEETSTSVSVKGAGAVSDEAPIVPAAPSEKSVVDINPASETTHHEIDEAPVRDSSESTARSLGSVPRETPKPDPERMRMPSEMKTPKQTLVEAGTEFKGTLKSSCPVVVNGTIDGDIEAPTLNIAITGAILGSVKAKTLRSQGTLSGNVEAEEVFLSGAVRSKTVIKTRRLEVKIGSSDKGQLEVTFGNCDLEVSEAINEPESPSASLSSTESENENDPFTSSGWDSAEVSAGSVSPVAAAASSRSTSKSSRRSEGSGDDTKKTLR
jgi:cytoskeletal protein CcmA (bactofilin family)